MTSRGTAAEWLASMTRRGTYLDDSWGNGAPRLVAVLHITFEIYVEELEDQVKLLIGVHNVEEP